MHAQILNIVEADYEAGTDAVAMLFLRGIDQGDCGDEITITVTLEAITDGTVYTIDIDEVDFFSANGAYVNQTVDRDQETYKLTVVIHAPNAESHSQRSGRTSGNFFPPQTNDTMSHTRTFNGTSCALTIDDLTFVGFTAEGEWDDPVIAGYSASFFAESTCTDVQGTLTVYDSSGVRVGSTDISTFTIDGNNYSFNDTGVEIANQAGNYYASLVVVDNANGGAPQTEWTNQTDWQPACYPEVVSFTKTG